MCRHYFNIKENNYHHCNRTSLPSLVDELIYVLMLQTNPGRLHQNLSFLSSALTYGIPFQTVGDTFDLYLEVLHHPHLGDAQAFSTFLQFLHLLLLFHLMMVCPVLPVLQKEKFSTCHHVGAHPDGHQHGVSKQISINVGKKLLRISCIKKLL